MLWCCSRAALRSTLRHNQLARARRRGAGVKPRSRRVSDAWLGDELAGVPSCSALTGASAALYRAASTCGSTITRRAASARRARVACVASLARTARSSAAAPRAGAAACATTATRLRSGAARTFTGARSRALAGFTTICRCWRWIFTDAHAGAARLAGAAVAVSQAAVTAARQRRAEWCDEQRREDGPARKLHSPNLTPAESRPQISTELPGVSLPSGSA